MSKGTTLRNVRVSDELWDTARAKADREGVTLSEILREALQAYVSASEES